MPEMWTYRMASPAKKSKAGWIFWGILLVTILVLILVGIDVLANTIIDIYLTIRCITG